MGGIGVLGGTFNPVHGAHVRHAVEVGERLGLDRVLLMPNSVPPHKAARGLLPFELRVELLRAAAKGIPLLEVCTLEGELHGPSYTWRSMDEFRRRGVVSRPDELYLMLGVEDFAQLDTWKRGLELPAFANLVIVPREGAGRRLFEAAGARFWPRIWNAGQNRKRETIRGRTCPWRRCFPACAASTCRCRAWTSMRRKSVAAGWKGAASTCWFPTRNWL